ncbi:hypothetical protein D0862_05802 [Hortaea werneckii]|uniref:BTB domain-containing protein n=1 Tax=Hortaea werneckii TaxID=91943 RepID=A0A3M7GQF1_HORWE|nr:hypothetical protein D0862_05802 [Hortaea werneckii]
MSEGQFASNEALQKLLDTGEYSDLTIKCGDHTFQVHKNIVCARSEYFAAACTTGTIELESNADPDAAEDDPSLDDPDAVKLMIDYLYLHDYELITTCFSGISEVSETGAFGEPDGDYGAIMDAKVYALGCKYQIPSLQSTSLTKFEEAAALAWDSEEFAHAVHLVHTITPDSDKGLRDVTVWVIHEHDDELYNKPAMEAVIKNSNGLAFDLLKEQTNRHFHVTTSSSTAIATKAKTTVAIIARFALDASQVVRIVQQQSIADSSGTRSRRGKGKESASTHNPLSGSV